MSRPSRRVRQRLAKRLAVSSEAVKLSEQARKERLTVARLKAVMPGPVYLYRNGKSSLAISVGKLTCSNGMLSPDNLSQASATSPGMYDGKIRIRGQWRKDSAKGFPVSKAEALEIGLLKLFVSAMLEAVYVGNGTLEDRKDWLTTTGFSLIRWLGLVPYISGENRTRSIRALNSGSGKPKRKLPPKRFASSQDKPAPTFRLIKREEKRKLFQETGVAQGKVIRETTRKK